MSETATVKRRKRRDSVKSCGKRHPYCGVCRPDVIVKKSASAMGNTSGRGYKPSDEHRAKISAALRGYKHTDETRANMSIAHLGIKRSKEAVAKHSARMIGNTYTRGTTLSEETRAKMSAAQMGRKASTEARANMRRAQSNRSPEYRAKLSAGVRKHIAACNDSDCRLTACSPPQSPTRIENALVDVLLAEFPTVARERKFGPYRVDAYLPPPYHLAFEADGTYWHGWPDRVRHDATRDAYLLAEHGLPVIRLTEPELLKMAS